MYPIPIPNILGRSKGFARLMFRNTPDFLAYRVRVANTLDNAYGTFNGVTGAGTAILFDVRRDASYLSPSIQRSKCGVSAFTLRGQTHALYNPDDFFNPPTTQVVPPDVQLAFLRIQVRTPSSAFPVGADNVNQSPICILPDPTFYEVPRPALTLGGTAPEQTDADNGLPPPPGSLFFHVPSFADAMVITNLDTTNPLLLATGRYQPMAEIPAETSISHTSGMKDVFAICAKAGNPRFSLLISVLAGLR